MATDWHQSIARERNHFQNIFEMGWVDFSNLNFLRLLNIFRKNALFGDDKRLRCSESSVKRKMIETSTEEKNKQRRRDFCAAVSFSASEKRCGANRSRLVMRIILLTDWGTQWQLFSTFSLTHVLPSRPRGASVSIIHEKEETGAAKIVPLRQNQLVLGVAKMTIRGRGGEWKG
jgi:hypothetical protein